MGFYFKFIRKAVRMVKIKVQIAETPFLLSPCLKSISLHDRWGLPGQYSLLGGTAAAFPSLFSLLKQMEREEMKVRSKFTKG